MSVILGEHDVNAEEDCTKSRVYCNPPLFEVSIDEIFVHDGFNRKTFVHDIALIRTKQEIKFDFHLQPICLNFDPQLELNENDRLILAGWGRTEEQMSTRDLLEATLRLVKPEDCQSFYPKQINITDDHLCAIGWGVHNSCK